jgi:hypothetical protein
MAVNVFIMVGLDAFTFVDNSDIEMRGFSCKATSICTSISSSSGAMPQMLS